MNRDFRKIKPFVGVTTGDPAGIGPEIICKSLYDQDLYEKCNPVVIGSHEAILKAIDILSLDFKINYIEDIESYKYDYKTINLFDIPLEKEKNLEFPQKYNGEMSIKYMDKAYNLLLDGQIDATASGPCNKEMMKKAGLEFPGATEYFADLSHSKNVFTVISQAGFYIFQATSHISLNDALSKISKEFIYDSIMKSYETLLQWGLSNPLIAVTGVNPHASDGGLMGNEELDFLSPAIQLAKEKGVQIEGPIPADAIFINALKGKYNCIISIFHDQANIPVKLMESYYPSVVITGGLPFIRTTVAHGTAYDIAYQGIANYEQMKNAIKEAGNLAIKI